MYILNLLDRLHFYKSLEIDVSDVSMSASTALLGRPKNS